MSKAINGAKQKPTQKSKRGKIFAAEVLADRAEKFREENEDEKSRLLLEQAQELDPDNEDAAWWLGDYWHTEGKIDIALKQFRRYLKIRPGDPEALHMISALGEGKKPKRASDGYVRDHFDAFAEHFDESLVDDLKYQVPKLLYKLVRKVRGTTNLKMDMLDLGVGTGLVGVKFQPIIQGLWGVDLSTEMARKARARGIYKAVAVEEITKHLKTTKRTYDLVAAADVLIYFGDLVTIFKGVNKVLRPGGMFAVSAEAKENGDFELTKSGRYSHSLAYLEKSGQNVGLRLALTKLERLRYELDKPVMGHIAVFTKPNE